MPKTGQPPLQQEYTLSVKDVPEQCDSTRCIKVGRHEIPVLLPDSEFVRQNSLIQGWYMEVAASLKQEWEIECAECTERMQANDGSFYEYWLCTFVEPQEFEFDGNAITLRAAVFPWNGGTAHLAEEVRIPIR